MNIFFIDLDPDVAARQLVDKHVVKMIVESAQLLSTAHRVLDGTMTTEVRQTPITRETGRMINYMVTDDGPEPYWSSYPETEIIGYKRRRVKVWGLPDARQPILYAASHMNHPSGLWARTTRDNYMWLFHHMDTMMDEYTYRYGKVHSTERLVAALQNPPNNLTRTGMTPAPSCMPDDCKVGDLVTNYRTYYNKYKRHIFNWKRRPTPDWIR